VIVFSGADLDRAAAERRRPEWLEERRADQRARAVLMSERGVWLDGGRLLLEPPGPDAVFLGLSDGVPLFADHVGAAEPAGGHPAGLREAATELPAGEAALAAYAGSLLAWHRRHRFCANCGAPTESRDAGHERVCPACDAHHFPRTDPVVIVRVTDGGDGLLLGRQARWPEGRFSLLAGYVEPGETLEEAVRREVLEESGVEVDGVSYIASQPWPFPSSLMLGFSALAERGDPAPGDDELAEVRWFERAEVEAAAAGEGPLMLAPPYSIARRLIDAWLASGPDGPDRRRRSS
jgi:NAD+ diphosphatase